MREPVTETDVVVVGGGIAGLTAACYLARSGRAVTLFEQAKQPGGRARSQAHDGFIFNRGIHALYTGGAASEVFSELGVAYHGGSPGDVWALRQGQLYLSPATPRALLTSSLFSLVDKIELALVLGRLPRLDPAELRGVSVQAWLEESVRRPLVREFLSAQARTLTYTAALDLVSAEVFIGKLQRLLKHPIVYLDGGWQTLVESLRRVAEAAGVRVECSTGVEALEHSGGCVRGVRLRDGQRVSAEAVVLAMNPKDAAKLVDQPAMQAIAEATSPVQVACLDVALRRLPVPKYGVVQDLERPLFMSAQSLASSVAPVGGALIYAFKQLDPRRVTRPQDDEGELESLLDAAQPGWRERVVKRQFLPRIEAVGTLPTARAGGFMGRPEVRVSELDNLFLVGDWVGPTGFLVDASVASARDAAHAVLRGSIGNNAVTCAEASGTLVSAGPGGETNRHTATQALSNERRPT